ncbi:hypothetical protein FKZ61_012460 [Litorilinea aerophila]|uniref:Uncharacterized protein n=1 Tax=Litorilinea aerophila TaxID=1204385 RepID=A0A540VGY9_9CHLR|nr:hypothetical protein [Litorilinea aerophila]MCC9076917.1 hypothetical protein [Litorilinea aerophila]
MNARRIFILAVTLILIGAVFTGVISAMEPGTGSSAPQTVTALQNVRDYAFGAGQTYVVDGGKLYVGAASTPGLLPARWTEVTTPADVIVGAVAIDEERGIVYIGAANEMAIYRSQVPQSGVATGANSQPNWQRVPLTAEVAGGVTDIAVDPVQRLVYVGTDNAGLFRLRDVGSSMVLNAQLLLDEPVRQVVAAPGADLALARTDWHLYRAENFGLSWVQVDDLIQSVPTALAVAAGPLGQVTAYVGTMDRGVLKTQDGITWTLANQGLGLVPGSRLSVDALAVDPAQPEVVYVSTSYLYGTTQVHRSPAMVAMSTDGATAWTPLETNLKVAVVDLVPAVGQTGAVYALTTESRALTSMPLGTALAAAPAQAPVEGEGGSLVAGTNPGAPQVAATSEAVPTGQRLPWQSLLAWIVAGLAALALVFAVVSDLRSRQPKPVTGREGSGPLAQNPVHNNR